MNKQIFLKNFRFYYRHYVIAICLQWFCLAGLHFASLLFIFFMVLHFYCSAAVRNLFLCGMVLNGVVEIFIFFKKYFTRINVKTACLILEQRYPEFKNIYSAVEMADNKLDQNYSDYFLEQFLFETNKNIKTKRLSKIYFFYFNKQIFIWGSLLLLLILNINFFLPDVIPQGSKFLLHNPQDQFLQWVKVYPGSIKIVQGSRLKVQAVLDPLIVADSKNFKLEVGLSGQFKEVPWVWQGSATVCSVVQADENLQYRYSYKHWQSPLYNIAVMEPLKVTQYKALSFAKKTVQVIDPAHHISLRLGTKIQIQGQCNYPLKYGKICFENGKVLNLKIKDNQFQVYLQPLESAFYRLSLRAKNGIVLSTQDASNVFYSLQVQRNQAPQVTLIFPTDRVVLGEETVVPLTFFAQDDWGLKQLFVRFGSEDKMDRKILLKQYNGALEVWGKVNFNMENFSNSLKLPCRLRLEILDEDGACGYSRDLQLQVQPYQKKYEQIQQKIFEFKDQLEQLVQAQKLAQNLTLKDPVAAQWHQKEVSRQLQQLSRGLDAAAKLAQNHPFVSRSAQKQYDALSQQIKNQTQNLADIAEQSFLQQQGQKTVLAQQELLDQLQDLSAKMKQSQQQSRGFDLQHTAQRLADKTQHLEQLLQQKTQQDTVSMMQLKEVLESTQRVWANLRQTFAQWTQEQAQVVKDHVQSVQSAQQGQSQIDKTYNNLRQALEKQDFKTALAAAQLMAQQVQQLQKSLQNFMNQTEKMQSGNFAQAYQEHKNNLEKIVQRQQQLFETVQKMQDQQNLQRKNYSQHLFDFLFNQQQKSLMAWQIILSSGVAQNDAGATSVQVLMRQVQEELKQRQIMQAKTQLNTIISFVQNIKKMPTDDSENKIILENVLNLEKNIEASLQDPFKNFSPWSSTDIEKIESIQKQQTDLKTDLQNLQKSLQKQFFMPASQWNFYCNKAIVAMSGAATFVSQKDMLQAQNSQQEALHYLERAMESLQSSSSSGSSSGSKNDSGGASGDASSNAMSLEQNILENATNADDGSIDSFNSLVVPSGADKSLQKMRQTINDSLKERYPADQQPIIREYFKRLSD